MVLHMSFSVLLLTSPGVLWNSIVVTIGVQVLKMCKVHVISFYLPPLRVIMEAIMCFWVENVNGSG